MVLKWISALGLVAFISEFFLQISRAQSVTVGNASIELLRQAFIVNYEGNSVSVCSIEEDGMFNDCNKLIFSKYHVIRRRTVYKSTNGTL